MSAEPDAPAVRGRVIVELIAGVVIGAVAVAVCGYTCVRNYIKRHRASGSPAAGSWPERDRREARTWRERARSVYVAAHGACTALDGDAIEACEPGEAGVVRRTWLADVIAQARTTGQDAKDLAAEAVTSQGRRAARGLATALADLAGAAEALLAEAAEARLHEPGAEVKRKELAAARGRVETAVAALRTLTTAPDD